MSGTVTRAEDLDLTAVDRPADRGKLLGVVFVAFDEAQPASAPGGQSLGSVDTRSLPLTSCQEDRLGLDYTVLCYG